VTDSLKTTVKLIVARSRIGLAAAWLIVTVGDVVSYVTLAVLDAEFGLPPCPARACRDGDVDGAVGHAADRDVVDVGPPVTTGDLAAAGGAAERDVAAVKPVTAR
jgi:hypothetical protein